MVYGEVRYSFIDKYLIMKVRIHKKEDIPFRVKWLNNPRVNQFVGDEPGKKTTLKKQQQWFDNYSKNKSKKFFTICDGNIPIWMMGLSNINKINKNADLFIVIGEDEYRGKWYGKNAMIWLLNYAFDKLDFNKVNLWVFEENKSAVNLYKKLWFEVEWIMKEEEYFDDRFHNFLSMAIFKRNWKN